MVIGLVGVWLGALGWSLRGMREVKNRVDCNTPYHKVPTFASVPTLWNKSLLNCLAWLAELVDIRVGNM